MQKEIVSTVIIRGTSTALNFLIALLIARHAGPAVKGDVTLLITILYFFIFFSNILGGQALVYLIPRNKVELLVVPAYCWSLLVSLVGFVFLKSTLLIHASHIPAITVLSFLSSLIYIHQTILLAKKRINTANIVSVLAVLIQLTGVLCCFYFLNIHDVYAYIWSSLAAYVITAGISFFMIWHLVSFKDFVKHFSVEELKESFRYGFLYQLAEILQLFNLRYYFFQLGLQQGPQYLGIYSIGISILEAVWIIPRSISTLHYVSTSNSNEVKQELQRTVRLLKLSLLSCGALLLVIYFVPASAYTFVFGEGFRDVKHSIRFLFPGIFIYNIFIVISSFYTGIGRYLPMLVSSFAGTVTLVTLSFLLIPKYVMSGAGLAASVSFAVASVLLLLFFVVEQKLEFKEQLNTGE